MAKLKENKLKEVNRNLTRLIGGDIDRPFAVHGAGEYRSCLEKTERLRQKMMRYEDEKNDLSRQHQWALASVVHDLKTPLSVVAGYAECLQDGINDKNYAKLIGDKIAQSNELIQKLLSQSKEEFEKSKEQMQPVRTKKFFEEVCDGLSDITKKKHDRLIVGRIPSATIRIIPTQIARVMQNLISNAVKYSAENSVVRVSFRIGPQYFTVKIKDNGIGISKEERPYIFNRFYKADPSRTDGESNGVGLYTAEQIVSAHGGKITVRSKPDRGSEFFVQLPLYRAETSQGVTHSFDSLPNAAKIPIVVCFGFAIGILYRIAKYFETKKKSTLIGVFLSFLLPLIWFVDIISVAVYGKITILAD